MGILVGFVRGTLTHEDREWLRALLDAEAVTLPEGGGGGASPPSPVPTPGNGMEGWQQLGAVRGLWSGGVPSRFELVSNPEVRWADCPPELWAAITRHFPQEVWFEAPYIAFLESDFRADAHNPNLAVEDSRGPFQINVKYHTKWAGESLYNYDNNSRLAAELLRWRIANQGYGARWADWFNSSRMLGLG